MSDPVLETFRNGLNDWKTAGGPNIRAQYEGLPLAERRTLEAVTAEQPADNIERRREDVAIAETKSSRRARRTAADGQKGKMR